MNLIPLAEWFLRRAPAPLLPAPVRARKERMRVSDEAIAEERAYGQQVINAFQIPKPMPGIVIPPGMAMDSNQNIVGAYQFAAMNSVFSEGLQFMGYPYLAELTQRAEYRRPAEIIAKEMTRKWIKITVEGEEDKSATVKIIEEELERLGAQSAFRKAIELDGYFGRAQIHMDLGVRDDAPDELSTPMARNCSKIPPNSLQRLVVIEPIWTYPNQYNSDNPLDKTFYRPQSWLVLSKEVHSTRLLTFVGRPMPDILKPAYMFGGLSLSQMSKPYVDNWLRTRQSVSDLIHSFSVFGLATDMGSNLDQGAAADLRKRATLFNAQRDNRNLMIIDKDTEEFFNVACPVAGLHELQAQSQEHMSSVNGIPLSVLLGITPSGLNASSEGEIRTFYQWIEAQQESMCTPQLQQLIDVIQISKFGSIDPTIKFNWEPLWSQSEIEEATTRKTDAETDTILIDAGVILPEEARKRVASEENSPYSGLDLSIDIVPPVDEALEGDMVDGMEPDDEDEGPSAEEFFNKGTEKDAPQLAPPKPAVKPSAPAQK